MSRQVTVSYVVLTLNNARTLRSTLNSIKSQTMTKEIIIVDSGSTDNTLQIAKEFKAKVIEDVTFNLAIARNIGLAEARARYVAFVDSDCILFPGWDKRMKAYLQEDDIAGAGCNWISIGNNWVERAQDKLNRNRFGLQSVNSIATMNAMYDMKKVGAIQFNKNFARGGEDMEFNFMLRANGYKLILDNNRYVGHHNPNNLMALFEKYREYGKWFNKPFKIHDREKDSNYWFRQVFLATFVLNFLASITLLFWTPAFIFQLVIPWVLYTSKTENMAYGFVHAVKFYGHQLGMLEGWFT